MTVRNSNNTNHGLGSEPRQLHTRPVDGLHKDSQHNSANRPIHYSSNDILDLNSEFSSDEYDKDYIENHHGNQNVHGRKNKKKSRKKSKLPLIIIIIAAALVIAAYILIALNGRTHFLPNTFVRGQEVSWLTAEEAEAKLITNKSDFVIKKIDGEEKINFADIDYQIFLVTPAEEIIASQNIWTWPLRLFSAAVYTNETEISYDKNALALKIAALEMFKSENIIKCKNAYIGLGSDGHYVIVPEVVGNELKKSDTVAAIKQAVADGLYEIDLVEKDLYKKPTVLSDDANLNKTLSDFKVLNEEIITIDLEGGKTITLAPADLVKFVEISGNDYWVNEEYLAKYMDSLVDKYETYMKPRNFKTHSGKVIKVGGSILGGENGDTYGYWMDKETSTDILRDAILSGQTQTVSLAWITEGIVRDDYNRDIGKTYIEISITEQHMWYYVNGVVALETDVVTGLGSYEKRQTPEGVFCACYKDTNVQLTGAMDGDQWKTKVAYWISVTWTGVGIHDADWQPTFGGDWYWWNGSHGCINTPPAAMANLFSMVELYTPIVIYSFSDEHVTSDGVHATRNNYQNEEYVEPTTTAPTTTAPVTTTAPDTTETTTQPVTEPATDPVTDPVVDPEPGQDAGSNPGV